MRATPFWRDVRFWRISSQVLFLLLLLLGGWYLVRTMNNNLTRLGTPINYRFLKINAGFEIGESLIPFDAGQTFARAYLVGVLNTVKVAVVGIILATLVGFAVGLARLSANWLVSRLAMVYVEVLRNTPVLLQIVFWYSAVFLKLPRLSEKLVWPGPVYLSNRGLALPWFDRGPTFLAFAAIVLLALVAAVWLFRHRVRAAEETGRPTYPFALALAALLLPATAAYFLLPARPLAYSRPVYEGSILHGGTQLTPEFGAVLLGLVIYTSAYIAEIVRAGIQAVPRGQVEAARALGLRQSHVLRFVVLPQALRVIIPPLTSQYLNLTKNSSLAIAAGFPDLFSIATTIMNQTGRFIEMLGVIMLTYLSFSLLTSLLMNLYNRSVRIAER